MCTLISEVFAHDKGKSNCKIKKIQLHIKINFKGDIFRNHFTACLDFFLKSGLLQPCSTNVQGRAQQHFSPSTALFLFCEGFVMRATAACGERSA